MQKIIYGFGGLLGSGRPIALLSGQAIYAIHTDHRLAPVAVTDSNRRVLWQADVHDNGAADVLPGSELEVKPIGERTPIVLRIVRVFPHGTAFRYDLEYYGLEPGSFDLKDYLQRKDRSSTARDIDASARHAVAHGFAATGSLGSAAFFFGAAPPEISSGGAGAAWAMQSSKVMPEHPDAVTA